MAMEDMLFRQNMFNNPRTSFQNVQFAEGDSVLSNALNFMKNRKPEEIETTNIGLDENININENMNTNNNINTNNNVDTTSNNNINNGYIPTEGDIELLNPDLLPKKRKDLSFLTQNDARNLARTLDVNNPSSIMAFQKAYNNETGNNIAVDGVLGEDTEGALRFIQQKMSNTRMSAIDSSNDITEKDAMIDFIKESN
tara:strand:- start:251 stop:844 length:594 start_codon:yes stop_codon:yes gene_type:complete